MGLFSGTGARPIFEGVDSIIGQKARIKGELTTSGSVNINGEFEGKIKAEGEVIVSPGGKITGEIHGGGVVVSGLVEGNIFARDTLEIAKSGRVHGDLIGGKIVIQEGSSYQGRVKVNQGITNHDESKPELPEISSVEETPIETLEKL